MKRLLKDLKIGLLALVLFVIGFGLCCLGGFTTMSIAKIFANSEKLIWFAGVCGYIAVIAVIFILSFIGLRKHNEKNSQKDTRN